MPDGAPTSAAERQRRFRERRREGLRRMAGDVPADLVRALVENGWLGPDEANEPRKIGAALLDLADCWMRGTLEPPEV